MSWLEPFFEILFPGDHPYGCLSLLPPLCAITLAIATRRVVMSLLAGVFVGSLVLAGGNPITAIAATCEDHLWKSLSNEDHLRVFVFTLGMGAMVGVMQRGGGMEQVVNKLMPLARDRRSGQLTVWFLGMIVFFDDYANSLLLGNTMRPLTDRLRISREKLAYLVDSTAAPVSGLAIVSTWVATEIGLIQSGFESLPNFGQSVDGFSIFLATIPYRFYVVLALLFVPMVAILGRDFGSMLIAEREASGATPKSESSEQGSPADGASWHDAFWPVIVMVGVTVVLILHTGSASDPDAPPQDLLTTFGSGDTYLALVYGSLSGLLTAMTLSWCRGTLSTSQIRDSAFTGAGHVVGPLTILWVAWALSGLTTADHLGTGEYLGGLLQSALDVRFLPTAVFILASLIAFATGTSWGTMGILMPLVIAVVYRMLADTEVTVTPENTIMVAAIGSVLAGAIFGDHCSPISDTTVLSSQSSGCDHIAHVRTQLPYAMVVGTVSIVFGTLPIGFGVSVWILLPLCLAALALFLVTVGRRAEVE